MSIFCFYICVKNMKIHTHHRLDEYLFLIVKIFSTIMFTSTSFLSPEMLNSYVSGRNLYNPVFSLPIHNNKNQTTLRRSTRISKRTFKLVVPRNAKTRRRTKRPRVVGTTLIKRRERNRVAAAKYRDRKRVQLQAMGSLCLHCPSPLISTAQHFCLNVWSIICVCVCVW